MLAVVVTHPDKDDPLSALSLRNDWPEPQPGLGESLIRVAATTVNRHDFWELQGGLGKDGNDFPKILGGDIVGWDSSGREIIVTGCYGNPDNGRGDETLDPGRSLPSEIWPGSLGEYTVVPTRNVLPKPDWLGFREAACLMVSFSSTYRLLFTRGGCKPGERLLIQGAGGGVSTAAITMARAAGLYVIATSRSGEKREKALAIGAHEALPIGARLKRKVDVVLDTVGTDTWSHSLRCVRSGGRILTLGATTGTEAPLELNRLFFHQLSIIGSTSATRWEVEMMLEFLHAANIRPVIDSVYTINDIHEAFRRMQSPSLFGNVVVEIAAPLSDAR